MAIVLSKILENSILDELNIKAHKEFINAVNVKLEHTKEESILTIIENGDSCEIYDKYVKFCKKFEDMYGIPIKLDSNSHSIGNLNYTIGIPLQ